MTTQTAPRTKVYRYGPNEYHVEQPRWDVASDSNPKLVYLVWVDEATDLYVCTCPDHTYRRRDCKHIRRVQAGAAGKPRMRMQVRPRPVAPATLPPATVDDLYG